jgi:hypothetical protein
VSFVDFTTGVSGHLWYNTATSRWVAPNISKVPNAFIRTCQDVWVSGPRAPESSNENVITKLHTSWIVFLINIIILTKEIHSIPSIRSRFMASSVLDWIHIILNQSAIIFRRKSPASKGLKTDASKCVSKHFNSLNSVTCVGVWRACSDDSTWSYQ